MTSVWPCVTHTSRGSPAIRQIGSRTDRQTGCCRGRASTGASHPSSRTSWWGILIGTWSVLWLHLTVNVLTAHWPAAVLQLYRYHSLAFPYVHRRGHAIPLPDEFSGPGPSSSSVLQRHVLRIPPSPGPVQPCLLHKQLRHHGTRP